MAKKPDTPCAGGCGKLLWGGSGSKPAGERMCQACRSARASAESAGRHSGAWRKLREKVLAEESDCFRCGLPVDKTLSPRTPMSASVDHKVDIAAGGEPLARNNVALAHYGCNSRAGAWARHERDKEGRPESLPQVVATGDRRRSLEAIRDRLARELELAEGRDVAPITKALLDVLKALEEGKPSAETDRGGGIADLTSRIARRRAAPAG